MPADTQLNRFVHIAVQLGIVLVLGYSFYKQWKSKKTEKKQ